MTSLMVNVASPRSAAKAAALAVEGVGLMRAEFMFYSLGRHPRSFIEEGRDAELVDVLRDGMIQLAKQFFPRPVRYRSLDFKSNEMRSLIDGERYEPVEGNPALGLRGTSRAMRDRDIFLAELKALRAARESGFTNLQLMVPFVRSVEELVFTRQAMEEVALDDAVELWAMLEIPAMIYMIEDIAPHIDGVSIGTNDLTQMMLGVDRDNEAVAHFYDDGHPAVVRATCAMIRQATQAGLQTSICGDRPSRDASFVRALLDAGIGSLSVTGDAVDATAQIIQDALSAQAAK